MQKTVQYCGELNANGLAEDHFNSLPLMTHHGHSPGSDGSYRVHLPPVADLINYDTLRGVILKREGKKGIMMSINSIQTTQANRSLKQLVPHCPVLVPGQPLA